MEHVNRLDGLPDVSDDLVPKTSIDHLLTAEQRSLAKQEREEIEEGQRRVAAVMTAECLYPTFYQEASGRMAAGESPQDVWTMIERCVLASPDEHLMSIVREAYEDALAGRPPRYKADHPS